MQRRFGEIGSGSLKTPETLRTFFVHFENEYAQQ
jgi:hypothetical protein